MYQPMSQQFHGPAMDSATALFVPKSWRENIRARGQLLLLNRMPRTVSAVAIGITIPAVSLPSDANPWPPYVSGFQSQGEEANAYISQLLGTSIEICFPSRLTTSFSFGNGKPQAPRFSVIELGAPTITISSAACPYDAA
jgi:hypothetical protein